MSASNAKIVANKIPKIPLKVAAEMVLDMSIEDVAAMITEVVNHQPMHPAKRSLLLIRLEKIGKRLEDLKTAIKLGNLK